MYSGKEIVTVGETDFSVSYKDQEATLPLVIVSGTGPSLLGCNWLSTLRLDWLEVYQNCTLLHVALPVVGDISRSVC